MSNSEIVQLLANDCRTNEIALKAGVNARVIERRIRLIKKQVSCHTIAAVVSQYQDRGLIIPFGKYFPQ